MPRSKVDPGRPSKCSPNRILCVGFCSVETIAICTWTVFTVTPNNGAVSSFREYGFPCGLCGSLCTLQLSCSAFASVTIATLGMNGWLGLIHQGLSPWKKRQASLGAPTVCLSGSGGTGKTRLHYRTTSGNVLRSRAAQPMSAGRVRGWRLDLGVADPLLSVSCESASVPSPCLVSIPCHLEPDMRFSLTRSGALRQPSSWSFQVIDHPDFDNLPHQARPECSVSFGS